MIASHGQADPWVGDRRQKGAKQIVRISRLLLITGMALGMFIGGGGATALAANSYGSMPGQGVSTSHTVCADAGAFGAFGPGNNWGQDPPGPAGPTGHGADGQLSGQLASGICGSAMGTP